MFGIIRYSCLISTALPFSLFAYVVLYRHLEINKLIE